MFTLYGGNGKTWAEMTPEEQKICLMVVGIMFLGLAIYGIYYFFKNKKDKWQEIRGGNFIWMINKIIVKILQKKEVSSTC